MNQTLWIVLVVVVVLILLGIWLVRSRAAGAEDRRRAEAQRIREQAEADRIELQRREAEAARVDAQARLAQAEAQTRAAEAARLQSEAHARSEGLTDERAAVDERLRRADELDPDVTDVPPGAVPPERTGAVAPDVVAGDRVPPGPAAPDTRV